jgi:endoglucanase
MRPRRWMVLAAAVAMLATAAAVGVLELRDDSATALPTSTGAPHPVVEDNRLVDARSGRDFVPRGVNWSSFEYACAQGWGLSSLETLVATDALSYEAAALASWGANTVRLPLNQDCWLGTRGAPVSDQFATRTAEDYRSAVAAFVTALNRAGLVVVLDLHSRKRIDAPEFGNLAMPDAESLAFWRSVAELFAGNPSVMFDAFNEPYSRYHDRQQRWIFELSWKCWRDGGCRAPVADDQTPTVGEPTYDVQGMQAVVDTIRDAGAGQPVLLGGLDYANDLSHWLEFKPDDDQLVAAFHSYDFKRCADPGCWDEEIGRLADSVPVLTSELGATEPTDGYVEEYLAWADRHRLGALFWVWADHGSDPMSLLREQGGKPTAYGRIARAWLAG